MSRRARVAVTSAALLISLLGGATVLLFSGPSPQRPAALRPVPSSAPEPEPSTVRAEPDPGSSSTAADLYGGLTSPGADTGAGTTDTGAGITDASALLNQGSLPAGGSPAALPPAPSLPVFQFPAPPQFPAAPTIDWQAALGPYIQSQMDAAAANLASSITGTAVGSASGAFSSAAAAAGDLVLFADYIRTNNPAMVSQLQSALPAVALPAAVLPAAALQSAAVPDFSGLSAAFAEAAARPPIGVPAPPQLPQLPPPPDLPTPEQVAAALAIPAVGLPALAVPALPPPPIGLPPPPPIGLPAFQLPSITRLLGLPF